MKKKNEVGESAYSISRLTIELQQSNLHDGDRNLNTWIKGTEQ